MSAATVAFLILRISHVLLAALWVGGTGFVAFFLLPAAKETGAAAVPLVGALMRRRLPAVMASLGGTTVLTGIYLYWRFTSGFDPAVSATRAAMVFGTGGASGILALLLGGAILARSITKVGVLGERLASIPDGPQRAATIAEMAAARQRAMTASRVVMLLQVIALAAMAIGHYV